LIALPARGGRDRKPIFRFAGWLPQVTPWHGILIDEAGDHNSRRAGQ
jgi:hypothetical protein